MKLIARSELRCATLQRIFSNSDLSGVIANFRGGGRQLQERFSNFFLAPLWCAFCQLSDFVKKLCDFVTKSQNVQKCHCKSFCIWITLD